jgi:hypothetical protein
MSVPQSAQLLLKAKQEEYSALQRALATAQGFNSDFPSVITKADASRANNMEAEWQEMQEAKAKNNNNILAAAMKDVHEASRFRRDFTIATASHKRLIEGCFYTAYKRAKKLERQIKQMETQQ